MRKTNKDLENLKTALRYLDEGYRLLNQAARDDDEFDPVNMVKNKKRARFFFNMFQRYVEKIENIEKTVKQYSRKTGIPASFIFDKIMNNVDINKLEGVR